MNAKELRKLSMDELLVLHRSGLDVIEAETVQAEIRARIAKDVDRPHWSTVPAFWVSVIAAVAACIAAYPVLFSNKVNPAESAPHDALPGEAPTLQSQPATSQVDAEALKSSRAVASESEP